MLTNTTHKQHNPYLSHVSSEDVQLCNSACAAKIEALKLQNNDVVTDGGSVEIKECSTEYMLG
jgi:hypothetical protein